MAKTSKDQGQQGGRTQQPPRHGHSPATTAPMPPASSASSDRLRGAASPVHVQYLPVSDLRRSVTSLSSAHSSVVRPPFVNHGASAPESLAWSAASVAASQAQQSTPREESPAPLLVQHLTASAQNYPRYAAYARHNVQAEPVPGSRRRSLFGLHGDSRQSGVVWTLLREVACFSVMNLADDHTRSRREIYRS